MSFDRTIFFCMKCNNLAFSKEEIPHKDCVAPFILSEVGVTFKLKRTRWGRFTDWLFSKDIGFGLAIIGALGINFMIMQHFSLPFWQAVIEGLCVGFVIPRLLMR